MKNLFSANKAADLLERDRATLVRALRRDAMAGGARRLCISVGGVQIKTECQSPLSATAVSARLVRLVVSTSVSLGHMSTCERGAADRKPVTPGGMFKHALTRPQNRTGWSLCDGINFLEGGCPS